MSTLPPPLPGTARKSAAANFVDVLGKISLLLGVLGVLYALAQWAVLMLLPDDFMQRAFATAGEQLPPLPSMLRWLLDHLDAMAWIALLSALLFLLASWGVLKRNNTARLGFIALMVLGTLMNFASIALLMQMVAWMDQLGTHLQEQGQGMAGQMQASNAISMGMGVASALAFAALHGWIIYKLCTPAVRAEFDR
jgi:type II secretory pathway component PulF